MPFCGCFRPSAKYEVPIESVIHPGPVAGPQTYSHQDKAVAPEHAAAQWELPSVARVIPAAQQDFAQQPTEPTSEPADVTSHEISNSPVSDPGRADTPGQLSNFELAADVIYQDNIDAIKPQSPDKAVLQNEFAFASATGPELSIARASDAVGDTETGAADAAKYRAGAADNQQAGKTTKTSGKASTTPNKKPWGARAPPAQTTPVRGNSSNNRTPIAAKTALLTPNSSDGGRLSSTGGGAGQSPSVNRPTVASAARVQAAAPLARTTSAGGTWRF